MSESNIAVLAEEQDSKFNYSSAGQRIAPGLHNQGCHLFKKVKELNS